tara:strand:- start:796 stop:1386 length:591 start_codon:yes stop_codon:yes gene_type:complete
MSFNTVTNDEEAYQTVRDHLLEQKEQASDENGECQYLVMDSYNEVYLKCAVGVLINELHYHEGLESVAIDVATRNGPYNAVGESNPRWELTTESGRLMKDLQEIHDDVNSETWPMIFDMVDQAYDEFGFDITIHDENDIVLPYSDYERSGVGWTTVIKQIRQYLRWGNVDLDGTKVDNEWCETAKEKAKAELGLMT